MFCSAAVAGSGIWSNSTSRMARAGFKQTLDLFPPPSCFCSSQRNHFQLEVEVQDERGAVPRQWHNYHRLGFNHTLLRLLSAHYLTPNTTAPLPETGQFSPLMSLRILAVMDNHRRDGGSESWDIIIHHILSHLIFFFLLPLSFFIPLLWTFNKSENVSVWLESNKAVDDLCQEVAIRKRSETRFERQFQGSESSINLSYLYKISFEWLLN